MRGCLSSLSTAEPPLHACLSGGQRPRPTVVPPSARCICPESRVLLMLRWASLSAFLAHGHACPQWALTNICVQLAPTVPCLTCPRDPSLALVALPSWGHTEQGSQKSLLRVSPAEPSPHSSAVAPTTTTAPCVHTSCPPSELLVNPLCLSWVLLISSPHQLPQRSVFLGGLNTRCRGQRRGQ